MMLVTSSQVALVRRLSSRGDDQSSARADWLPIQSSSSRATYMKGLKVMSAFHLPIGTANHMYGTANQLIPVLLLGRSGMVANLPRGVIEDLHAGVVCALAECVRYDRLARFGLEARHIVDLIIPNDGTEELARGILSSGAGMIEAVLASTVLSNLAWARGNLNESIAWGQQSVRLSNANVPESWRPYPYLALAEKLIDIGELSEAEVLVKAAGRETAGRDDHPAAADVEISGARLLYASRRFRTARRKIHVAVEHAARIGADWTTRYGLLLLALTDIRIPDLHAACESMRQCQVEFVNVPFVQPSLHFRWGEYLVSTICLNGRRALEMLTGAYSDLLAWPTLFILDAAAAPWLVWLALTSDDPLLATRVLAAVKQLAIANPTYPAVEAAALHAGALVSGETETLRGVAEAHRDVWASRLAEQHLRFLSQQGATHGCAERHTSDSAPRQRPNSDFQECVSSALTTTENRIARLVSHGLTNQQIAHSLGRSPHTVNYHLRRIFEKLKVRSRVELATYFIRESAPSMSVNSPGSSAAAERPQPVDSHLASDGQRHLG